VCIKAYDISLRRSCTNSKDKWQVSDKWAIKAIFRPIELLVCLEFESSFVKNEKGTTTGD
jgi:hypothetical protein